MIKYILPVIFMFVLLLNVKPLFSQSLSEKLHLGFGAGINAYKLDVKPTSPLAAFQANLTYEVTDKIHIRLNGMMSAISAGKDSAITNFGPDSSTNAYYMKSNLWEISLLPEYDFFNMNEGKKMTPFVFGGVGFYHFRPYQNVAYRTNTGALRYTRTAVPQTEKYSNTQLSVPFGIGIKYALSNNVRLNLSGTYHLLFTDYLDGYKAGGKDAYYSVMLGISFRLKATDSKTRGSNKDDCKSCPRVWAH